MSSRKLASGTQMQHNEKKHIVTICRYTKIDFELHYYVKIDGKYHYVSHTDMMKNYTKIGKLNIGTHVF